MAVPTHTEYAKIADLKNELSSLYTKLTSVNDEKFNNLIREFMYNPASTPAHVPNEATSAYHLITAIEKANTQTYKSGVPDFMNLLKDALECRIEPNVKSDGKSLDNNEKMNGLLKFVKKQTSAIAVDTVKVEGEPKVAHNIISSINVINAFLEILKSYSEYIEDVKNNPIYDITNIFIVNVPPESGKRFKYLKADNSATQTKPAFDALYLEMDETIYSSIVSNSTIEVDTNYLGISNTKNSTAQATQIFASDAFSLVYPSGSSTGYVRGIRIHKKGNHSIIDETDGAAASPAIINPAIPLTFDKNMQIMDTRASSPLYGANLQKRDQYLLKHFLNIIFNIKKESRYTTIKILQIYYTIMKILLLTAVNTGNHLYNSKYASAAVVHTSGTLFGLKGLGTSAASPNIDAAKIYTGDTIDTSFKIDTSYEDITANDDTLHGYINSLIEKITADSANSIGVSTTLPTLSNGFYAKKLDDNHIMISQITILADATNYASYTPDEWRDANSFNKSLIEGSSISKEFKMNRLNDIKKKYRIKINDGRYEIVDMYIDVVDSTRYKYKIKASLSDPNLYPKTADGIFDITKYNILDLNNAVYSKSTDQYIGKANNVIFKKDAAATPETNQVKIVQTTPQDNAEEYNNIKSNIMEFNESIKLNKSKINNYRTLYELHKSKNNLLNTQLITYYVIIAIIIGIIITINLANIEKPFIKTVASVCFGVVILLFISYYIMNVVYINEEFTVEHFASAFALSDPASITIEYQDPAKNAKMSFVEGRMDNYCEAIILALKILKPSLENSSLINTTSELLHIGKNESNERLYINNVLINKRDNTEISIDVIKYENMNFAVHIKALLTTAVILIGIYTLHLYIDRKYIDLLLFITTILLIIVFTYFVVYSNKIVRTTSSNNYWGKEYENQYI